MSPERRFLPEQAISSIQEPIDILSMYRRELDQLPRTRLSREQEEQLRTRIVAGDPTARGEIITGNIRLVMKLALSVRRHVEVLDLIQAGNMGLTEAAQRYEHVETGKFQYYAAAAIKNKINEHLLEHNLINLPPEVSRQIRPFLQAEDALLQRHFRQPTISEIAEHMGVTEIEALEVARGIRADVLSLNTEKFDDSDENHFIDFIPDDDSNTEGLALEEKPSEGLTQIERLKKQKLEKALMIFTPRQRQFIRMQHGQYDGIQRNYEDLGRELHLTPQNVGETVRKARGLLEEDTPERRVFSALVFSDTTEDLEATIASLITQTILANVMANAYDDGEFQEAFSPIHSNLTPRQQQVLAMYHGEGLLFREIGKRIGLGEWPARNDYKSILIRAKPTIVHYLTTVANNPIEDY